MRTAIAKICLLPTLAKHGWNEEIAETFSSVQIYLKLFFSGLELILKTRLPHSKATARSEEETQLKAVQRWHGRLHRKHEKRIIFSPSGRGRLHI